MSNTIDLTTKLAQKTIAAAAKGCADKPPGISVTVREKVLGCPIEARTNPGWENYLSAVKYGHLPLSKDERSSSNHQRYQTCNS